MQQTELKAHAIRVLERTKRNTPSNGDATKPKKACNLVTEIRVQKLHSITSEIIEVAVEIGARPESALSFFTTLDWRHLADGVYGTDELKSMIKYANQIDEQSRFGLRVIDGGKDSTGENDK